MFIDYHTHVIPYIDDGSSSEEESIEMLRESKRQGVDILIATPHFYVEDVESVDYYLKVRHKCLNKLKTALVDIPPSEVPLLLHGAEVFLTPDIPNLEGLEKLCIKGTNYLLLELPFQSWSEWVYRAVFQIISERNLQPIIAHLDRYLPFNKKNIDTLLSMEVYIQVNADSVCSFGTFREIRKWYNAGLPLLLGSDTHNCNTRKTHYGKAVKKIEKKLGADFFTGVQKIDATLSALTETSTDNPKL